MARFGGVDCDDLGECGVGSDDCCGGTRVVVSGDVLWRERKKNHYSRYIFFLNKPFLKYNKKAVDEKLTFISFVESVKIQFH